MARASEHNKGIHIECDNQEQFKRKTLRLRAVFLKTAPKRRVDLLLILNGEPHLPGANGGSYQ
ncbi:hypothetical protein EFA69_13015 [Rufibacter immobilis]|uniref:Uncharacterized protein n=1 Tax=Rufibacter immobilis TaxID=1348778 RepID=A0A3M9MQD0_9BACT|nr:hypothetical protein EFA69_13015 [Rufibacter immobilis]